MERMREYCVQGQKCCVFRIREFDTNTEVFGWKEVEADATALSSRIVRRFFRRRILTFRLFWVAKILHDDDDMSV